MEEDQASASAPLSRKQYGERLKAFDSAICEAVAVSQAQAGREADLHVGYASKIYARMCGHGISMIRAAPLSRWVHSDFYDWNFSTIAVHARAIMEGLLILTYLLEKPSGNDEVLARINVMHLYDCTKRIEFHEDIGNEKSLPGFREKQKEIRGRLKNNNYFKGLDPRVQKSCLSGKKLYIRSRDQLIEKLEINKGQYDALYDLYSQHSHILTFSFYRMEPNGRGTGVENDVDRTYIGVALQIAADFMQKATDFIVEEFPDTADVREGAKSKFSHGPKENAPDLPSTLATGVIKPQSPPLTKLNPLAASIHRAFDPKGED